jgi:hypothetical protein
MTITGSENPARETYHYSSMRKMGTRQEEESTGVTDTLVESDRRIRPIGYPVNPVRS